MSEGNLGNTVTHPLLSNCVILRLGTGQKN